MAVTTTLFISIFVGQIIHTPHCLLPPPFFSLQVGLIKRQFSGNDQHDAQEVLTFLLDGLSEELNLVHDKPYIEHPDSDNRPDTVLADIWWANHLSR